MANNESLGTTDDEARGSLFARPNLAAAVPVASGEQGATGPAGPAGAQGPQGETGPAGAAGAAGARGQQGEQGIQGERGETGATGAQGAQGNQGDPGPQGPRGIGIVAGQTSSVVAGTAEADGDIPYTVSIDLVDPSGATSPSDATFTFSAPIGPMGADATMVEANVANPTVILNSIEIDGVVYSISTGIAPPVPEEHAFMRVNPTEIQNTTGTTTVVATMGVGAGFTYTGFQNVTVTGPTTRIPSATSGTGTTFNINVPNDTDGTYRISAEVLATNSAGDVQAAAAVSATFRVFTPVTIPDWYTAALTSVPTALSQMTDHGDYVSPSSTLLPAQTNGRAYILVPTRTGGYTITLPPFGLFVEAPTEITQTFLPGYTLLQLSTNDYIGDGTLEITVTEA